MGLKVLKWVYDLGVKQERTRIARLLEHEIMQRRVDRETRVIMYEDSQNKMGKARLAKLKQSIEISSEVSRIIDKLFERDYDTKPTSLMFPEEEK